MPASTEPVTVYGWELHLTGPKMPSHGSDKYYRVLIVDTAVLINYGRRATLGQFLVHKFPTLHAAKAKASELTDDKSGKGYIVTRDMTAFDVTADLVGFLTALPIGTNRPSTEDGKKVIESFKSAATDQGTVENEASR